MNRHAGCKAAIGLFAGVGLSLSAHAQVLKDPLPDSFTLAGVTLYGTVDVGYAYQSQGVPLSSKYVGGLEYQAFTTTRNFAGSQSTLAESGLEQSKIGIRIEEPLAMGFTLVGRLETGFNPLSAQLTDACAALAENSGVPQGKQTANADSSRCGQPFNSVAFGGVSSKVYGTLTVGRQNAPQLDALVQYDPQALSYAFSFLGYSGFDGGAGSTEGARWDNSVKYALNYGPAHGSLMFSNGGRDTGVLGQSYGIDLGATVQGLSVDFVYDKENGAVNLRSSFDNGAAPLPTPGLAAYASDDEAWNIMGKYVFDLSGGAKDSNGKPIPGNKLTVYAGYSHIQKGHSGETGGFSQGDYPISIGININNSAEYSLEWFGARYAMPSGLNVTGAFYHVSQNSWSIGLASDGTQNIGCSGAGLLCAGDFTEGSLALDYVFNKHYDTYLGVNYSTVTDGLANGFVGTTADGTTGSESQTTVMAGFRIKF